MPPSSWREFADALSERARAGVKVHVLLDWLGSGKMDAAPLEQMRSSGVRSEKFHKPHRCNLSRMNNRTHRKVLVVDALWVSVGSTNFDNRSFRLNDEANLNIYDADFARRQIEIFEDDLRHSRRISLQQWQQRPLAEKLRVHAAALLRDQL